MAERDQVRRLLRRQNPSETGRFKYSSLRELLVSDGLQGLGMHSDPCRRPCPAIRYFFISYIDHTDGPVGIAMTDRQFGHGIGSLVPIKTDLRSALSLTGPLRLSKTSSDLTAVVTLEVSVSQAAPGIGRWRQKLHGNTGVGASRKHK